MHPIEFVHKKIADGYVLNLYGEWVLRNTALQNRQYLINQIVAGNVEINGRWVSLKSIRRTWELQSETVRHSTGSTEGKKKQKEVMRDTTVTEKRVSFQNQSDEKVTQKKGTPNSQESVRVRNVQFMVKSTVQLNPESVLTISETELKLNKISVFTIEGFVDQSNCRAIQDELVDRMNDNVRFFIFDLSRAALISSAGWGTLAALKGQLSKIQGDLMIVFMNREIEESFRLLQFGAVLKNCSSYEECLHYIKDLIQKNMIERATTLVQNEQLISLSGDETPQEKPLQEKIKIIIERYGPVPIGEIGSILKQNEFGREKIGFFKLYMILREMSLDTEEKRKRFYRSC